VVSSRRREETRRRRFVDVGGGKHVSCARVCVVVSASSFEAFAHNGETQEECSSFSDTLN
jgi:hypothetical protein